MLQDLEAGRPLEIEALLGAVVEMAGWLDMPTPIARTVLALVRQRARAAEGGRLVAPSPAPAPQAAA
jgi:2-dehydropantoate 2-reductase